MKSSLKKTEDENKHFDILKIENAMKSVPKEIHLDCPITHTFSGGVYVREMFMPRDMFAVGKRHRHETCNILLKGRISVFVSEGDEPPKTIEGPCIFTSPPFSKKMVYAHEDSIFLNIHPTTETDLEKIEKEFIITEDEYEASLVESDQEVMDKIISEQGVFAFLVSFFKWLKKWVWGDGR